MLVKSIQHVCYSAKHRRDDCCTWGKRVLGIAEKIRDGLPGIKLTGARFTQIDSNTHNREGSASRKGIQIDQNASELSIPTPQVVRPLQPNWHPGEFLEADGNFNTNGKAQPCHLCRLLLKAPPYRQHQMTVRRAPPASSPTATSRTLEFRDTGLAMNIPTLLLFPAEPIAG